MRAVLSWLIIAIVAVPVGCQSQLDSNSIKSAASDSVANEADDPASVASLRSISAQLQTDDEGFVVFVDVSERDDITDRVFQDLKGLPRLKEIHAIYTPITGAGLKHLSQLHSLEVLNLFACPIPDVALKEIESMHGLRSLNLAGTRITDDSVALLSKFQQLEYLAITDTKISEDGRLRLESALPSSCEID